ncbi:MAG: hypothetical protein AB1898_11865 [Acidobacteriota bacterium]
MTQSDWRLFRRILRRVVLAALIALSGQTGGLLVARQVSGLTYTYPVERLKEGHSFGNQYCYVTLDGKSDIPSDRSTARFGLRESFDQKYYLLGWDVQVAESLGGRLTPQTTTFTPAYQQTELRSGNLLVQKTFFLPFENNYRRSAHFLFNSSEPADVTLEVRSRWLLPAGTTVTSSDFRGRQYLVVRYAHRPRAVIWSSGDLTRFASRKVVAEEEKFGDMGPAGGSRLVRVENVELSAEYAWSAGSQEQSFGLSFAYTLEESENASTALLNGLFDIFSPEAGTAQAHIKRLRRMLSESQTALNHYLETARLWTPEPLLNRASQWAKVNQLRLQQEVARGASFTNNPPSDIVVGRDTVWYVMGSSYYAQAWSRKLLDLWFRYGLEPSGKFVEYFAASREPIFKDDYGLNIADNTPLMLMAVHQYYSLTGDQGFLREVYPRLLDSANYILSQREVGSKNRFGLVWCTSEDTFVRGLPVWRNAVPGYNLCGAPTELNAECVQSLLLVAELAGALGDDANRSRLESAAESLKAAINQHLRSSTATNPYYYLHINTSGEPVDDLTGDLLFPVLCDIAEASTAAKILAELFGEHFWAETEDGAGGIRTVSARQGGRWGYQAQAKAPGTDPNWNYGLLGGVWPNLAMWAGRAAAKQGLPDLSLKALRGTYLLSERENPEAYNVVPGEISGYCNGDDLVQKEMPMSPFLPGIFIWSSLESFLGMTPRASGLVLNPELPTNWGWVGVSNLPYRGHRITLLADRQNRRIYSTMLLKSGWEVVTVPVSLQERFRFEAEGEAFWLVIPAAKGLDVVVASTETTQGKLIEKVSGRVLGNISIPAGSLVRKELNVP